MDSDNTQKGLSTGVKVGLIAIAINMLTVGVYMYQTNIMQKQLHAGVWPYVEWRTIYNQDKGLTITVSNNGIGPALLHNSTLKLAREEVPDLNALLKTLLGTTQLPHVRSEIGNRVLPPGASVNFIEVTDELVASDLYRALNERDFKMEICFESIYGEQWLCLGTEVLKHRCH